jgi:predicted sulfurtransferase
MARELKHRLASRNKFGDGWQGHTSAFDGRVMAAHEQFRSGIQLALQGNFPEVAAQLTMEDAETHATVGQCAEATREVPSGLALSRDNATLEHASRALASVASMAKPSALLLRSRSDFLTPLSRITCPCP